MQPLCHRIIIQLLKRDKESKSSVNMPPNNEWIYLKCLLLLFLTLKIRGYLVLWLVAIYNEGALSSNTLIIKINPFIQEKKISSILIIYRDKSKNLTYKRSPTSLYTSEHAAVAHCSLHNYVLWTNSVQSTYKVWLAIVNTVPVNVYLGYIGWSLLLPKYTIYLVTIMLSYNYYSFLKIAIECEIVKLYITPNRPVRCI